MLLLMFGAVAEGSSSPAPPPSTNVRQKVVAKDQQPWPKAAAQPLNEMEDDEDEDKDYAIWNPAPYFAGAGYGAPIPHPKDVRC